MNNGKTIFSQLMEFISHYEFVKCVKRYNGNYKVLSFNCWEQFLCMSFAQLTNRESLRGIEACLRSKHKKLYHVGIRSKISRSTLADANEKRDWRIYRDLGHTLIQRANKLYANDTFSRDLKNIVYALDSTSIEFCASLFPWAIYGKNHAAICMHALLNLKGNIPSVIVLTDKKVSELKVLDQLEIEPGAIYIVDRGYIDFSRFYALHENKAFFVTRAKTDFKFNRLYSQKINKKTGVQCDQIIKLKNECSLKKFPENLRRIKYTDLKTQKKLVFLTNNMLLSTKTIVDLYRSRWQIELFFKWIKQHLRIKAFFGRSENAVKTQIWIAVSTYLLVAIVKKELNIEASLYTILQVLNVSLFEKTPILQALSNSDYQRTISDPQMSLF